MIFSACKVVGYSQVNLDDEYCFSGKTNEEKSIQMYSNGWITPFKIIIVANG